MFKYLFYKVPFYFRKTLLYGAFFCFLGFIIHSSYGELFYQQPTKDSPVVFYSTHTNDDLKLILADAIMSAREHIFLSGYSLFDEDIIAILQSKAKAVPIKLYLDSMCKKKISKAFKHLPISVSYGKRGVKMHQKIVVIDHQKVIIGSENFTESSLHQHENSMIIVQSPKLATKLIKAVNKHYGHIHLVEQGIEIDVWVNGKQACLNRIYDELQKVKKHVVVAAFFITHKTLLRELKRLKKMLPQEQFLVIAERSKHHDSNLIHNIKMSRLFHHKLMWLDDKTLIIGSANFSKSGFSRNEEVVVIMKSLPKKIQSKLHLFKKRLVALQRQS